MRNYLIEGLNLDDSGIKIERAHRLSGGNSVPRPIIVKFSFFKDNERILPTYRYKKKAQRANGAAGDDSGQEENNQRGENYYNQVRVAEVFVERVAFGSTKFFTFMMDCINVGKTAYLLYDKLVVDDVVHIYDRESKVSVAVTSSGK